jgi:hypothetical protein
VLGANCLKRDSTVFIRSLSSLKQASLKTALNGCIFAISSTTCMSIFLLKQATKASVSTRKILEPAMVFVSIGLSNF